MSLRLAANNASMDHAIVGGIIGRTVAGLYFATRFVPKKADQEGRGFAFG
jgi:hypothetical protein